MELLTQSQLDAFVNVFQGDRQTYRMQLQAVLKAVEQNLKAQPALGFMPESAARSLRCGNEVRVLITVESKDATNFAIRAF